MSIKQGRTIYDPDEKERLLNSMGIFKHQIKEYGEMVARRKNKKQTNYAR